MVLKVIAAIDTNHFSATMTALVNISTGQHADPVVQEHLTGVKELGLKALSCSISGDEKKTSIVKLKTFHTQNAKPKKSSGQGATGKSDEVAALLRITQRRVVETSMSSTLLANTSAVKYPYLYSMKTEQ